MLPSCVRLVPPWVSCAWNKQEKSDESSQIWKDQCDSRVKPISNEKCVSRVQPISNKESACQVQPISNEKCADKVQLTGISNGKCAGKVQLRRMKNEEWRRTKGMAPLSLGRFTQLILKPLDSPKNRRGISNAGQGCTSHPWTGRTYSTIQCLRL